MAYLLDANVFIQAKNLHYGLDFCPAFWEWLITNNALGLVFNIEKVGDEIEAGSDELAAWAAQRGHGFFLKPDASMLPALGRGQYLGDESALRTCSNEHVPSRSRLLFGGSGTCP
jgi:hypothetical protein